MKDDELFIDVDRMVNEGLGGGTVSPHNGYIGDSTADPMGQREFIFGQQEIEQERR